MAAIFDELLDEDGSEIYMRPVSDYVSISEPVTFYTICLAALRRGRSGDRATAASVTKTPTSAASAASTVNPAKSAKLQYNAATDRVIVLAKD